MGIFRDVAWQYKTMELLYTAQYNPHVVSFLMIAAQLLVKPILRRNCAQLRNFERSHAYLRCIHRNEWLDGRTAVPNRNCGVETAF